ncbi:MAG TPA: hypothetical protein VFX28_22420 [Methylomirabilota bacterium]|nr:hypothetical protein [Methylomirabilota bacterium]
MTQKSWNATAVLASLLLAVTLTAVPALAHEGHDHGDGGGGAAASSGPAPSGAINVASGGGNSVLDTLGRSGTLSIVSLVVLVGVLAAAVIRVVAWANSD